MVARMRRGWSRTATSATTAPRRTPHAQTATKRHRARNLQPDRCTRAPNPRPVTQICAARGQAPRPCTAAHSAHKRGTPRAKTIAPTRWRRQQRHVAGAKRSANTFFHASRAAAADARRRGARRRAFHHVTHGEKSSSGLHNVQMKSPPCQVSAARLRASFVRTPPRMRCCLPT
jgi:hypothetical protein